MIYSTAIGLSPGGSTHLHTNNSQNNTNNNRTTQITTNVEEMTIWRMCIVCWTPKATNTHTQVVQYSLLFHYNNGCTNAPQCYLRRTLHVLLTLR